MTTKCLQLLLRGSTRKRFEKIMIIEKNAILLACIVVRRCCLKKSSIKPPCL
jgi:porphobilinogen deaminase